MATSIFKGALGSIFGPHSFNCIIPLPLEEFLALLFVLKKDAGVPSLILEVALIAGVHGRFRPGPVSGEPATRGSILKEQKGEMIV